MIVSLGYYAGCIHLRVHIGMGDFVATSFHMHIHIPCYSLLQTPGLCPALHVFKYMFTSCTYTCTYMKYLVANI